MTESTEPNAAATQGAPYADAVFGIDSPYYDHLFRFAGFVELREIQEFQEYLAVQGVTLCDPLPYDSPFGEWQYFHLMHRNGSIIPANREALLRDAWQFWKEKRSATPNKE